VAARLGVSNALCVADALCILLPRQRDCPRVQILSVADLLNGAEVKMPAASVTFKQAQRERGATPSQGRLDL
jgi:hypothetical protein